jgi:phosphatidylethanolamine-binding protein (PEBP) family uncharacterized protein
VRHRISNLLLAGGFTLAALCVGPVARAAEPFTLSSPEYQDNAELKVKNAGNLKEVPSCVAEGQNVSPPLAWANAPDTAKSFALTIVDPEGFGGAGFVHLVAYGIPTSVTGFAEGELGTSSDKLSAARTRAKWRPISAPALPPPAARITTPIC